MPSEDKTASLALFASGTGSNAEKICTYFKEHESIHVKLIVSNRIKAGVFDIARRHEISSLYVPKAEWSTPDLLLPALKAESITHIILAGFLLLLPDWLLSEYGGRILNIHPALLPRYGGHGMYGMRVHEAVHASGDQETGMTIHEVNERYDEGPVIYQEKVSIDAGDTPEMIANKVLRLEHAHYAPVIEKWVGYFDSAQ